MTLKPSAHGTLAKTPFAHLLLYLQARKLSGSLAVWPEPGSEQTGQDRVLFDQGELVAMRPVETAKTLYAALMPLFGRASAPYGFYEGHDLLGQSNVLREPIDLHTLLSRGLRVRIDDAVMDVVLERVRGRGLRLRDGAALERLELNQRELALVEPLRSGAVTLDKLLESADMPPRDAKRALYLLALVRAVEASEGPKSLHAVDIDSFAADGQDQKPARGSLDHITLSGERRFTPTSPSQRAPVKPTPRPSLPPQDAAPANQNDRAPSAPPPPIGLSALDEARWNDLRMLYQRLDDTTLYDLLQLPKTASSQELESSYYAMVKKYHPDRLPLALAPLLRAAQVLFDRFTEAHETLMSAERRAEYDKAVAGGGGTRAAEREMRNVLEAAMEFQKADVLVKRRDYVQAMQLLKSALAKSPDEADYHALYAYTLHLMNPGMPAPLDEMLRSLDRALKSNAKHERAHYVRGLVLKRLKRDGEAMRHFRVAAELNPHNVDAAREVRLANMRRDSNKPPAPQQGNVLSRLFKK